MTVESTHTKMHVAVPAARSVAKPAAQPDRAAAVAVQVLQDRRDGSVCCWLAGPSVRKLKLLSKEKRKSIKTGQNDIQITTKRKIQ